MNTITTHSPKFRIGAKEARQARRRQQSFIFKLIVLVMLLLGVLTYSLQAQILVSGATAANGTYTSLTNAGGAFAAINASAQTGNNILITITGNSLAETAANSLNANDWATLTIRPNGTREVSGSVDTPLLNLDGADNVTIDGRVSGIGTTKSLTIVNYSAGTSATTIRYVNSAENNTIKYSILKGSGTSISNASVVFYYTATSGNGNDNNTIDNCNLTNAAGARPFNLIFIQGTLGRENDNIVISNNNLYDFFSPLATAASRAISFSGFTSDVSITGNSFYETTALSLGSCSYVCIDNSLSTTAATTTVTGNYIGGSAPLCAGSAFTVNSTNLSKFSGISLQRGNSSIQNNTIKNISWTAENTGLLVFEGISVGGSGTHNIGTTQGNTIGASTGTGSITVTNTSSTSASSNNLLGMQANTASGTLNIQNNQIGSLTAVGGSTVGFTIYGINKGSTAITNISSNTIGSLTTANSIQTTSASTAADQDVQGIRINSGGATVTGNTIANLTNLGTRTGAAVTGGIRGISANVSGGQVSITNNTVRDLTTWQAGSNATTAGASCVGIAQGSTTTSVIQTVSNNTIYNLTNSNTGANAVKVYGIIFDGNATGLHTVNTNIVYNVTVASSSATAEIGGIKAVTGNTMYYNNIVLIGNGQSNSTPLLYGILDAGTSGSVTNSFYFNTVYVYGSTMSGSSLSAAFRSSATTSTIKNYRNNLFFNARSNSGTATGKHYAAYYASATNLTTNYNDYFVNGTGGILGNVAATDQATLIAFKAATLQDANSLNLNPAFANAGGTSAADYLPATTLTGVSGTGVTTDFLGSTRATPMIGAVEFASLLPVQLASFGGKAVTEGNLLEWTTASEIHNAYFEIQKSTDNEQFEAVGRVQGKGTSSQTSQYQFTDPRPEHELNYYRLKQVDFDGHVHFSRTISLRQTSAAKAKQPISVYPNPAQSHFYLTNGEALTAIWVYNALGQCVYTQTKNAGERLPAIDISDWKSGVYRVAATHPDGQIQTATFIK